MWEVAFYEFIWQYLFDELVAEYEQHGLTNENYDELYVKLCGLSHINEVYPSLIVMRYLEIRSRRWIKVSEQTKKYYSLMGLYYNLILFYDRKGTIAISELQNLILNGYFGKNLCDKSNINLVITEKKSKSVDNKCSR